MAFKDQVKPWFETGDYPTQNQFWQMMEWLRWKDEPLNIGDINQLTEILNGLSSPVEAFVTTGGEFTYTIPAGYLLEKVIVVPFSDCKPYATIDKIGGDVEDMVPVDDDTTITDLEGDVWVVNKMAIAAREITIYSLPADSKVYLIKRKII